MIDRTTSLALQRIITDLPLAYLTHQFWAPRAPLGVDINWAVVLTQFVLVQLKWMTESTGTIHLIDSLVHYVRIPSPLRSTTNFAGGG